MKGKLSFQFLARLLSKPFLIFGMMLVSLCGLQAQGFELKTIVIDPGHGGRDPGAVGKIAKEKDITLSVSLMLGGYIEKYMKDVKVIYTRKTDVFPSLKERPKIANDNNADLFVSIHVNALGSKSFHGASTWTAGRSTTKANLEIAKKENKVLQLEEDYEENYQGFDPDSPDSYIIFSMMQNAFSKQSIGLAEDIQDQFTKRVGRRNYGVHQAEFWVLYNTSMPSVLIELGFITNEKEERFLVSKKGQEYMASAIFRAIRSYKEKIEAQTSNNLKPSSPEASKEVSKEEMPIFKLQFLTSSKEKDKLPRKVRNIEGLDFYQESKFYKYTIGESNDINVIRELKYKYQKDYPDAFIIAFKKGVRMPISEALKEISK